MSNLPDNIIVPIMENPLNENEKIYAHQRFTPPNSPNSLNNNNNDDDDDKNIEILTQESYNHNIEQHMRNNENNTDLTYHMFGIGVLSLLIPLFGFLYVILMYVCHRPMSHQELNAFRYLVMCVIIGIILNIIIVYKI